MVCMQVYAWAWSWWIHIRHAIARNNKLSNKQSSNPNRSFSVRLVEKVLICWCKNKNVLLQYPQDNKLTTITPSGWTSTRMASRSMLKKKKLFNTNFILCPPPTLLDYLLPVLVVLSLHLCKRLKLFSVIFLLSISFRPSSPSSSSLFIPPVCLVLPYIGKFSRYKRFAWKIFTE